MHTLTPHAAFAITAPGLEALTQRELATFGIRGIAEPGGVAFSATSEQLYDANLRLRTASRVVIRLAEFKATGFAELERLARRLPWETIVGRGAAVRLNVTCRKSKLYHSDAVAQRILGAIESSTGNRLAETRQDDSAIDEEVVGDQQLFIVRFLHDRCTISADSSGALLHMRGYRQAVGKAPLRETLAAAMLLASEWDVSTPLLDPFCGSGTIAIEGALIARRMAPGLQRAFAFEQWPTFDATEWNRARERALDEVLKEAPAPIFASDRDGGAIDATMANAERAGVSDNIKATREAVSSVSRESSDVGSIVTNPPYGVRVGDRDPLRDLYARFGDVLRGRFAGWRISMLSAERTLERQMRLTFTEVLRTTNGGIPVRLIASRVAGLGERGAKVVQGVVTPP